METLASLGIRSLVVALALLACLSSASAGRFGGRREAMRRYTSFRRIKVYPGLYRDNNTRLFIYWTDPKGGNWWMRYGSDDVGCWPSSLFSHLADSASAVEWGGEVVNSQPAGEHTSTEMGSGHFSEEGYSKASYFRNIQIVDGSNNLKTPTGVVAVAEKQNCYNVQNGNNSEWGAYFYYGGPGRNTNCP